MKAIFITDMPDNCKNCKLTSYSTNSLCCSLALKTLCITNSNGNLSFNLDDLLKKPAWCPLREIPDEILKVIEKEV